MSDTSNSYNKFTNLLTTSKKIHDFDILTYQSRVND